MRTDVLGAWQHVLGPDQGSAREHTATTTFVAASDGKQYVLKRITGLRDLGQPRDRLTSEYDVLLHLRDAGLPVALPVRTDAGHLCATTAGDHAIYTFTPAFPADTDRSRLHPAPVYTNIGRALGRLHHALRTYGSPFPSWTIDLSTRTFDQALPDLRTHLAPDDLHHVFAVVGDRRRQMLDAMNNLPTQRVHGDFHGENILIRHGKVSGLIDLDHLPTGPRIYDLAYYLANHTAHPEHHQLTVHTNHLHTAARNLVAGYATALILTPHERSALIPVTLALQLQLLGWNLTQPGFTWSQDHINGLHWINQHLDTLGRQVTDEPRTPGH